MGVINLLSRMAAFKNLLEIEDYFKNRIHYLQHYMNIKGIKYEISIKFGEELFRMLSKELRKWLGRQNDGDLS